MSTKRIAKTQNKPNRWLILLPIVLIVGVILAILFLQGKSQSTSLPETISVAEAQKILESGAFLVDVREQNEWNEGHVEGAILIPLGEIQTRISEIPTDKDVLLICRSGNRSGQARDILREAGLNRTTSISGGMNEWIASGYPTITGP